MKLTKLLILFLFLSLKGFSQQAVLTSSGDKVILNFLSSLGGTISGTLTTIAGINNTGTITNTGTLINTGNLTVNGNGTITGTLGVGGNTTITGTLTLPSLSASSLLGTDGSSQIGTVSLTGDITTNGLVATLSNTGVISGTYGSSTAVPQITVDSKGRITTITTTAISVSGGSTITHTIGESYGGGKVFYVYDNGKHGLIAATSDQSTGIRWYGGSNTNTRARADGVGAGLKNTAIIIANQGAVDGNAFAATVCNEYSVTVDGVTYGDWYLPSKHELHLMYTNIGQGASSPNYNIGGFADDYYWSSSEYGAEYGANFAWGQNFLNGIQANDYKIYTSYVRAVRSF